jgi:hypothetical protein
MKITSSLVYLVFAASQLAVAVPTNTSSGSLSSAVRSWSSFSGPCKIDFAMKETIITALNVVNSVIAPDGFNRSYVIHFPPFSNFPY